MSNIKETHISAEILALHLATELSLVTESPEGPLLYITPITETGSSFNREMREPITIHLDTFLIQAFESLVNRGIFEFDAKNHVYKKMDKEPYSDTFILHALTALLHKDQERISIYHNRRWFLESERIRAWHIDEIKSLDNSRNNKIRKFFGKANVPTNDDLEFPSEKKIKLDLQKRYPDRLTLASYILKLILERKYERSIDLLNTPNGNFIGCSIDDTKIQVKQNLIALQKSSQTKHTLIPYGVDAGVHLNVNLGTETEIHSQRANAPLEAEIIELEHSSRSLSEVLHFLDHIQTQMTTGVEVIHNELASRNKYRKLYIREQRVFDITSIGKPKRIILKIPAEFYKNFYKGTIELNVTSTGKNIKLYDLPCWVNVSGDSHNVQYTRCPSIKFI